MRYLLDTNILSSLIREQNSPLADRIRSVDDSLLCTSVIVAAELWFGVVKSGSGRLRANAEIAFESITVLPLQPPADVIYAHVRADLESVGRPIGSNDLLIASQALALNLILVTDNVREFSRIDGLHVENWLRD